MNDEEFESFKFTKLKYRMGDQIIQQFWGLVPPKKLGPPSLIWGNLKKLRKVLLNDVEYIEIEFGFFKFLKLKYRRGDQIIQPFYRIGSP